MWGIRRGVVSLTATCAVLTAHAPAAQADPTRTLGVATMHAPATASCQFLGDVSCDAGSSNASFSPNPAQPGQTVTFTADDSWEESFLNQAPCSAPGTDESDLDPADFPTFPLARVGSQGLLFDGADPVSDQLDLPATVTGHDVETRTWTLCGGGSETDSIDEHVRTTFTAPAAGCYQAVAPVSWDDAGSPTGTHFARAETTGTVATLQVGDGSCMLTTRLTVTTAGDGSGSVGLPISACALPCARDYATGTTVHLHARAASNSHFDH